MDFIRKIKKDVIRVYQVFLLKNLTIHTKRYLPQSSYCTRLHCPLVTDKQMAARKTMKLNILKLIF